MACACCSSLSSRALMCALESSFSCAAFLAASLVSSEALSNCLRALRTGAGTLSHWPEPDSSSAALQEEGAKGCSCRG